MISHLSTEAEGLRNLSRIGTYFFLVMMAAAILLIRPGLYTDVIGLSAFGLVFLLAENQIGDLLSFIWNRSTPPGLS